jgi:hypothetical protein
VPTASTHHYYVSQDETSDERGWIHHHWVEAWDDDGHPMIVSYKGLLRVDQVTAFHGRAWSIHLVPDPSARSSGLNPFAGAKESPVIWH